MVLRGDWSRLLKCCTGDNSTRMGAKAQDEARSLSGKGVRPSCCLWEAAEEAGNACLGSGWLSRWIQDVVKHA